VTCCHQRNIYLPLDRAHAAEAGAVGNDGYADGGSGRSHSRALIVAGSLRQLRSSWRRRSGQTDQPRRY